jgi:hypothetical protein
MRTIVSLLTIAALSGCMSITATEPSICDGQSMTWAMPTIPAVPTKDITWVNGNCKVVGTGYAIPVIPSVTQSITVDLSSGINQVTQNLDSYTINLTELALDNLSVTNFGDWATVNVVGSMEAKGLPTHTFSYAVPHGVVTELTFDPGMTADEIVAYFSSGPVTLSFTLNIKLDDACGAAQYVEAFGKQTALTASADVCVSANGSVSKSL